jgi:hypothetical protein
MTASGARGARRSNRCTWREGQMVRAKMSEGVLQVCAGRHECIAVCAVLQCFSSLMDFHLANPSPCGRSSAQACGA